MTIHTLGAFLFLINWFLVFAHLPGCHHGHHGYHQWSSARDECGDECGSGTGPVTLSACLLTNRSVPGCEQSLPSSVLYLTYLTYLTLLVLRPSISSTTYIIHLDSSHTPESLV